MGSRRRGREAALQMVYQMDLLGAPTDETIALYWTYLANSREGETFANELVSGIGGSLETVDATIRGVSQHWRLERMTRVDRSILRLATYELMNMDDIPSRVTLNEAVELAKRFGSDGSAGFVNGVLDKIAADLGKA